MHSRTVCPINCIALLFPLAGNTLYPMIFVRHFKISCCYHFWIDNEITPVRIQSLAANYVKKGDNLFRNQINKKITPNFGFSWWKWGLLGKGVWLIFISFRKKFFDANMIENCFRTIILDARFPQQEQRTAIEFPTSLIILVLDAPCIEVISK